MSNWIFLSYPLNDKAFGYGNGERFKLNKLSDMSTGSSSNNTSFQMPTHYGTHIDFPFHFAIDGKKSTDYNAGDFVFENVAVIEINSSTVKDYLININDLHKVQLLKKNTDLLIVKTGFCAKRYTDEYWEKGLGFHLETADFLKQNLPNLRAIGFDLISLNSYQQRAHGREAHKEFLKKNDVLIIEELDLNKVTETTNINKVIVSPLYMEDADGAPVTIFAEVIEN